MGEFTSDDFVGGEKKSEEEPGGTSHRKNQRTKPLNWKQKCVLLHHCAAANNEAHHLQIIQNAAEPLVFNLPKFPTTPNCCAPSLASSTCTHKIQNTDVCSSDLFLSTW